MARKNLRLTRQGQKMASNAIKQLPAAAARQIRATDRAFEQGVTGKKRVVIGKMEGHAVDRMPGDMSHSKEKSGKPQRFLHLQQMINLIGSYLDRHAHCPDG